MVKLKMGFCVALLPALLAACPLILDFNTQRENLNVLEDGSFYAQNMVNRNYYKVKADLLWTGGHCTIWAEENSKISLNQAKEIAKKYDDDIRSIVVDTFSKKGFYVNAAGVNFENMLDYANWLAGRNDKKLTILLLDIKDGFKNSEKDSYVAGYFFSGNFLEKGKIPGANHYSNGRDMIYIDTYPGLAMKPEQTYATFAHELQHLISYVSSRQMNRRYLDTWVDEGLSSQAEHFYLGGHPKDKCEWFGNDKLGTIAKGNNFFVWDNHSEALAILDEYATVYLFFRWLYLQADTGLQSHIFRDIITSNNYDYRAVTAMARQIRPAWNNWGTLLGTWLAANYYPKNAYGYTGDQYLQGLIKVKPIETPTKTVSLYPGEGVYSLIKNGSFTLSGASGNNISYAGITNNQATITTASPYTKDVLLTFNANTAIDGKRETGQLTGAPPSSPAAQTARTVKTITGPYVIDAGDLAGRWNGPEQ